MLAHDVDLRIMSTFADFYVTLLGFVNYRLYQSANLVYPPAVRVLLVMQCLLPLLINLKLNQNKRFQSNIWQTVQLAVSSVYCALGGVIHRITDSLFIASSGIVIWTALLQARSRPAKCERRSLRVGRLRWWGLRSHYEYIRNGTPMPVLV